jgi:hypothetical protein
VSRNFDGLGRKKAGMLQNADKEKRDSKTGGIRIIIALNSGDLNQSAG